MQVSTTEFNRLQEIGVAKAARNLRVQQFKRHFSVIQLAASVSGSGPYSYAFAAQEIDAFGYGIGDSIAGTDGGGGAATKATSADTSLQNKYETLKGETFHIAGISVRRHGRSCAALAERLAPHISAALYFDGEKVLELGTLADLGGLEPGRSYSILPDAWHAQGELYIPNGSRGPDTIQWLTRPELWASKGKQSAMHIRFKLHRAQSFTLTARVADTAGQVQAFVPPTLGKPGTVLNLLVTVHGESDRALVASPKECCD